MLELKNINVFYADMQALWDVSLDVQDGEIVTIVGSNGAGKSTIMKTVAGLLKPGNGKILFNGKNTVNLSAHRIVEMGIALVPEGRRLFPGMTVLENLEVGASVKKARKIRHKTLEWVYEVFPVLKERSGQKAGTLSGGEQQMLAIGRAMMSKPGLLMIDEMSLGLSPLLSGEICRVIKHLNTEIKLTVLLVEQDVNMALSIADRAYVIENGRIINSGKAADLLNSEQIKEAYLGIAPGNPE